MKLIEKIKDIRNSKQKNKLVIFVGAGVSANSDIPTWGNLVKTFAKKLNYNKCSNCYFKDTNCPKDNCKQRYNFSQDEYLKIPQYFFNDDYSIDHEEYKNIIKSELENNAESNPINDIIMSLLPKHIITTNYDNLLEKSKNVNAKLYICIYKDKDLLTQNNSNYIIKMHGDINDLDNIVLKEEDYIHYEQTHILIVTYIKSLLIDHTFLFVGYSLNDYNLKLILGWIEYLAKAHDVKAERPKNYIIQVNKKETEKYMETYLESNNVYVLNTFELPENIKNKHQMLPLPDIGRNLYSCLNYILDEDNDYLAETLVDILYAKYSIFDDFRKISYEDLMSVHSFKNAEVKGQYLCFIEQEDYKDMRDIITSIDEKSEYIRKILVKSGILEILYKNESTVLKKESKDEIYNLFLLYLNNRYADLIEQLKYVKDNNQVAYYYNLILPNDEKCNSVMREAEDNLSKFNRMKIIIFKYNDLCLKDSWQEKKVEWDTLKTILGNIPFTFQKAYGYMNKVITGMEENLMKQVKLFEQHEKRYLPSSSIHFGDVLSPFWALQALAYDYYFYFKLNGLMLDYYSNPKDYLESYLKSILCTYYPRIKKDNFLGTQQEYPEYKINEIDLDMFVKYTNPDNLLKWLSKYHVKNIKTLEGLDIILKFNCFCESMFFSKNIHMYRQIYSFVIILSKYPLNDLQKANVVEKLIELMENSIGKYNNLLVNIFETITYIVTFMKSDNITQFKRMLKILLNSELNKAIQIRYSSKLEKVINNLAKYADKEIREEYDNLVKKATTNKEKCDLIYLCRKILNDKQKIIYKSLILDNLEIISYNNLFWLIIDELIDCTPAILNIFIKNIEFEINKLLKNAGRKSYPDHLEEAIDCYLILFLIGKAPDLYVFERFISYSDPLFFLLNPNNFDYKKVDLNNYMWINIFRHKKYLDILIEHRDELLNNELRRAIEINYATEEQKKITYRYLLSDDDFWNFGK